MRNKHTASKTITVHVYGSRYAEDKKLANAAYRCLGTGQDIDFPREGSFAHSHGIPITGDWAEIERYVWQFICIAEILGRYHRNNYQFVVHHFEGFSVEEIAPLFFSAYKIPGITLPREYHEYMNNITKTKGLPSIQDINVYDSLDERSAVRHFLGKTQDEIYHTLSENIDCDCSFMESFYYLGPNAFAYYVKAWEQFYRDFKTGLFHQYEYEESDVAEATLHFLSQRTLLSLEEETPQGRESILNLLSYCEQHYNTAEFERVKTLQKCAKIRETQLAALG